MLKLKKSRRGEKKKCESSSTSTVHIVLILNQFHHIPLRNTALIGSHKASQTKLGSVQFYSKATAPVF